ncbi:hypothetical protein BWGOE3_09650 [Bacillus mycoides]|nr:hypothetical protein BWGOE3_09650 [Bacillus mycoides]
MISPSMPKSQFDEKLVAASIELEDTIQKVQQFESQKEKSNAENFLDALNKQVEIAGKMSSLAYTDPQLQAEREMKKKQEEWAEHHPVEAWLQNFSGSVGEKWDVLRKGTKWVGENIPFLKGIADDALVLEGFLGAAGSAISGIAIGATKLGSLVLELGEWGFNSIRGVETEQWKLDDIYGAGNTLKNLGQAIISWQDYPKYGKTLFNSVKGYVEKALTDPYALGGAIFDIGSCFVGVGEVTAAVKGSAAFGKFAEGAKVFQVAEKSGKIGGKLEEIMAFTNKLPSSMKNVAEKIKNIEIPNLFRETAAAGVGSVEERKTLGELFSVAKSETKGQAQNANRLSGEKFDNLSLNLEKKTPVENAPVIEKKSAEFFDGLNLKNGSKETAGEVKFLKENVYQMNSFQESVGSILKNEGVTLDEFNSMRMKLSSELTDEQRRIMVKVREAVPTPNNDTILQKVFDGGKIENYLKEDEPWNTVGGFVTRAQDVKQLSTLKDVYGGLRLDYNGTPFNVGMDKDYGIIRFKTNAAEKLDIPYGSSMEGIGARPPTKGFDNSPDPFTGHGFTKDINGNIIPEYTMPYLEPKEGAELFRVNSITGDEELIAKLINGRFIKIK